VVHEVSQNKHWVSRIRVSRGSPRQSKQEMLQTPACKRRNGGSRKDLTGSSLGRLPDQGKSGHWCEVISLS
jgi:hypothetical protein